MQVRILFALLASGALAVLLSGPPGGIPEAEPLPRKLVLIAILVTSLGMVIPWGRWIPLALPGRNLGFISKLFAWSGASGVPLAVASGDLLAMSICVLLPLLGLALWSKRHWAVWPWFGIAVACLAPALWGLSQLYFMIISRDEVIEVYGGELSTYVWNLAMQGIWSFFWVSITVALIRELTALRRTSRSPGNPAPSAS